MRTSARVVLIRVVIEPKGHGVQATAVPSLSMVWFGLFLAVSVVAVFLTAGVMDFRARRRGQRVGDGAHAFGQNREARRDARAEHMYRYHPFDTNQRRRDR